MISDIFCEEQLSRLERFRGFPGNPAALKDFVFALQVAETEAICVLVIDDFVSSLAGNSDCPSAADIRRLAYSRSQKPADYFPPPSHGCRRCQDSGIYGGHLNGQYAGSWKWCNCPRAAARMNQEPNLIDEANVARDKLLALGKGKKQIHRASGKEPMRSAAEVYRGEF